MREFFALTLCLGLLVAQSAKAQTAQNCGPRETVQALLTSQHGEARRAAGLANNNMMELYANPETGSWSITITHANGTMCLIAAGRNFANIVALAGEPA